MKNIQDWIDLYESLSAVPRESPMWHWLALLEESERLRSIDISRLQSALEAAYKAGKDLSE